MKVFTLETLMALYGNAPIGDAAKTLDAADRLLQVAPNDLTALAVEAGIRKGQADPLTDATAKQAGYDSAASYAQKGLAATKPQCTPDADFNKLKANYYPLFTAPLATPRSIRRTPRRRLTRTRRNLPLSHWIKRRRSVRCCRTLSTWAKRTALRHRRTTSTAPSTKAARLRMRQPISRRSWRRRPSIANHQYHGRNDDQYAQLGTIAAANLNAPADLGTTIKPAPTPADIVNQVIASTPDLSVLALVDKEFILQNGTPDQAAKVWGLVKGKSFQFDNVLVIASTPTQVQVAISEDAVQGKTADFTFNLTPPEDIPELKASATAVQKAAYNKKVAAAKKLADDIAAATQPGKNVTLTGMYDSFTQVRS
jgi:hypothetical protein